MVRQLSTQQKGTTMAAKKSSKKTAAKTERFAIIDDIYRLRLEAPDQGVRAIDRGHSHQETKTELAEMKSEYENACKFATDYEQQRDRLRAELDEALGLLEQVRDANGEADDLLDLDARVKIIVSRARPLLLRHGRGGK